MKARFAAMLAFALTFVIVVACTAGGSTASETTAGKTMGSKNKPRKTSASYTLRQGDTVTLAPGTTLTLQRVNDSRCRQGAVCVWAGFISYTFLLAGPHGKHDFVLAENMPNAAPATTVDGLAFALAKLEPPEPPHVDAPAPDYRVTLTVSIVQPATRSHAKSPAP